NSELAPKDFKGKPANVLIAMQMGAEVGLAPMAAIQNIAVINGRPSIWGDAALGIVVVHPEYEWHKEGIEGEGNKATAWFTVKRRGQEAYTTKFSVDQAIKAGLWTKDGPWKTYPMRMLQMRARGFGIRDKFPDALRGLGIAEEVMNIPVDSSPAKQKRERSISQESQISLPAQKPTAGITIPGSTSDQKRMSRARRRRKRITSCARNAGRSTVTRPTVLSPQKRSKIGALLSRQ